MEEGTRIRGLDERLGTQELKLGEISEELSKTRGEHTQKFVEMEQQMERMEIRMEKVDVSLGELKELILGLHSTHGEEEGTGTTNNGAEMSGNPPQPHIFRFDTFATEQVPRSTPLVSNALIGYNHTMPHSSPLHTSPIGSFHVTTPQVIPASQFYYAPPTYSTTSAPYTQFQSQSLSSTTIPPPHYPPPSTTTGNHLLWQPPIPQYQHQFTPPPLYTYSNNHYQNHTPHQIPLIPQPVHQHQFNPIAKLEFPKFDGLDPKGWVIKAEQYFEFVNIDEGRKVKMAGLHFEGKASTWYRYYQVSKNNFVWKQFQGDVISRFENPENRVVQELFNKLKQTSSVADYEDKFEELRAQVVHRNKSLGEDYFVSSFISGLKDHIKTSVRMFRP